MRREALAWLAGPTVRAEPTTGQDVAQAAILACSEGVSWLPWYGLSPAPILPAGADSDPVFVGVPIPAARPAPLACSVLHKCPEVVPASGGAVEFSGRVLRLVGFGGGGGVPEGRKRGLIVEWSKSSRMHLLRTCMGIDWEKQCGSLVMVTLTYPGIDKFVPRDGRLVHRHLKIFLERWRRRYGERPRGLWKMEFQRRGAAHFHLFLSRPPGVPIKKLRAFVARAWWATVKSEDPAHLKAGTQVIKWSGDPTGYAWKYLKAHGTKEDQHRVPEGYTSVGRWWGLINLEAEVVSIDLTADQFTRARRVLRKWRYSTTGYRLRCFGAAAGFWLFTAASSRGLVDALMRAVT